MCLADSTTSKEVRESGLALPALRFTFGSHCVIVFIGRQGQGQLAMLAQLSCARRCSGTWGSSPLPAFCRTHFLVRLLQADFKIAFTCGPAGNRVADQILRGVANQRRPPTWGNRRLSISGRVLGFCPDATTGTTGLDRNGRHPLINNLTIWRVTDNTVLLRSQQNTSSIDVKITDGYLKC
jgi:hypothetical protein